MWRKQWRSEKECKEGRKRKERECAEEQRVPIKDCK